MSFNNEQQSTTYENDVLELFQRQNHMKISGQENDSLNKLLILCPLCAEEPGYYKSYPQTSLIAPYVHFHCTSCPYQWTLCRLCNFNMQPQLPSKRDQLRNIKKIYSNLINKMKQHTNDMHPTNNDKECVEEFYEDNFVDISTDNNAPCEASCIRFSTKTVHNTVEFKTNLEQIFPDVYNNNKKN